jgi:hypothetical protein
MTYCAKFLVVGMIDALGIETRGRNLAPGTFSFGQQFPQARGVRCIAGKLASYANDGDGLTGPGWPGASHGRTEEIIATISWVREERPGRVLKYRIIPTLQAEWSIGKSKR